MLSFSISTSVHQMDTIKVYCLIRFAPFGSSFPFLFADRGRGALAPTWSFCCWPVCFWWICCVAVRVYVCPDFPFFREPWSSANGVCISVSCAFV